MSHYRVELALSEVTEYTDSGGYKRDQSTTIAKLDLTAGTPGSAMAQILPHVDQLVGWHQMAEADVVGAPEAAAEQEANRR